jgi:phosphatidylglycerol---prolipoprotein diacylglyceryl transferase
MHPVLIQIGDTKLIHTFGVMVLLGVLAGIYVMRRTATEQGIDPEDVGSLGVEVFLAGLVGSRLMFVFMNLDYYADKPAYSPFNLREGGLVWYGGFLFGLPMAMWRVRSYGFPIARLTDIMAPTLILGLGIGRIGCLMAGDDFGLEWTPDMWWPEALTVTFTSPDALLPDAFRNKALLPSQPFMCIGCLAIFGILRAVRKKVERRPGTLSAMLFALYPIHRFLVEFTRGDEIRGFVDADIPVLGGLSTSQAISVLLFPPAMLALIYFLTRPEGPPLEPIPKPGEEGEKAKAADAEARPPKDIKLQPKPAREPEPEAKPEPAETAKPDEAKADDPEPEAKPDEAKPADDEGDEPTQPAEEPAEHA